MKKRILLAEDDQAILQMTKLRLEHAGFEVVLAVDGEAAINAAIGPGGFDLILLDIRMPKCDGFEVCRRLKAHAATASIPVVVITASSTHWQYLAHRCIELGVTDWLRKPFRSRELLEKIHRALGEPLP